MTTIRNLSFDTRFLKPEPTSVVTPTKTERVHRDAVQNKPRRRTTKPPAVRNFLTLTFRVKRPKPVLTTRLPSKVAAAALALEHQEQHVEIPEHIAAFEQEYLHEYLRLYATLKTMCSLTEERYIGTEKRSTRDVYALMALYSQQREVIADIRSIKSLSEHVHILVREVLQPFTSALAQNILDTFYHVRKVIKDVCSEEELPLTLRKMDDLLREQGKYLQQRYNTAESDLFKQLSDDRKPRKIVVANTRMGTTR